MSAAAHRAGTLARSSSRYGGARLYRDATALASSSLLNAVLGMAFWGVAAILIPPERLGVMTAVLAAFTAPAIVVAAGVGDAYTSLMPAIGHARIAVYRRGQRVFLATSVTIGMVCAIATITMLADARGSIEVAILVAVGTVVWAAFTLQNNTLTSLGRASWLPVASGVSSLGKIVLLPIIAIATSWHSIELAVVISAALVVVFLRPRVNRIVHAAEGLPTTTVFSVREALREFDRFVPRTLLSVALTLGVLTLTPFLVTAFAGSSQGALFALSMAIVQTLDFIGSALGVSLVVHASNEPESAVLMARAVLLKALCFAIPGAIAISAIAPFGLGMLDPRYSEMGCAAVISVLCVGCVIRTVYMVWAALQRSRRTMRPLLVLNSITAVVVLGCIPTFCERAGALGGALALLLAQIVLSGGAAAHFVYTSRLRVRTAVA